MGANDDHEKEKKKNLMVKQERTIPDEAKIDTLKDYCDNSDDMVLSCCDYQKLDLKCRSSWQQLRALLYTSVDTICKKKVRFFAVCWVVTVDSGSPSKHALVPEYNVPQRLK